MKFTPTKLTRRFMSMLLAALMGLTLTAPFSPVGLRAAGAAQVTDEKKIIVFSDPHYYAPELGTTGSAFEKYLAADTKLLAESDASLRKTVDTIKASNAGIVLIPGDLTKDGEMVSHQKVASYLKELEDSGKKVYVINGNHDINNPEAYSYSGDTVTPVPSVSPADFKELYKDFGYAEALAVDPDSMSYVVEPVKGLRIIVMDSALYDNNYAKGTPVIAGALSEGRLSWILQQTAIAKAEGKTVLGMMHHGLTDHFTVQRQLFGEYVISDADSIASALADAGMQAVFTGHFHAQDIAAGQGGDKEIYDIETGSLLTYPNPFRTIEVTGHNKLKITTDKLESINYDTGGLTFPDFAKAFIVKGLKLQSPQLLAGLLVQQGMPPEQAMAAAEDLANQEVAPALTIRDLMVTVMLAHYQGDEAVDPQIISVIQYLSASNDPLQRMLGGALLSLSTDLTPEDNDVILKLK